MSFVDKWMKCHVDISFATLECVWEYNMEISCKQVAYSCIVYTILYTTSSVHCNYYNLSNNTQGYINTMSCKPSCKTLYFLILNYSLKLYI